MSFILLGIINSQVEAEAGGAYELISTQVLSSSASSVTFSSIPQDYKHLQIRAVARDGSLQSGAAYLAMRFNGVTSTSYSSHELKGQDGSVSSSALTSRTSIETAMFAELGASTANIFSAAIIDILDYASASKNTTIRTLSGSAGDGRRLSLTSGLLNNQSSVTSLEIGIIRSIAAGSRFSIYGIKGE